MTYYSIKIFSVLISVLPRKLTIKIAIFIGTLINLVFPKRKQVAMKNLSIAFPDKSIEEIKNIIKKTYQHYMIVLFDFLRHKSFDDKNIFIDKQTEKILSMKNGLIFMTAHIGNWEMIIPILNKYKKITAIAKVQKNSGGDRFISEMRNLNNVTLLPLGSSTVEMINALNNDQLLALASDQNAGVKGVRVPFFGKELSIPKGAAYFYHKTQLPIIIGFCMLNNDNTYTFKLEKLVFDNKYENIEELFKEVGIKYNTILENKIKEYPEQYFWFHKKWDRKIYK